MKQNFTYKFIKILEMFLPTLKSLLSVLFYQTTWFEFFQRDSIKRPGPSQFYVELQKNVLFLLNDLVYFFFEKSLLNDLVSI